jgi:hypothetical protein
MKKLIATTLLCCMTFSNTLKAEPIIKFPTVVKPPTELDLGNAISPIKKDQIAPFTGVLLSPGATSTIIVELSSIPDKVKLEVDRAVRTCLAEGEFAIKEAQSRYTADKVVLQASIDEKLKRISVLEEVVKKQEAQKADPYIWAGLGLASGIIVTIATAFAVTQVTK